MAVMRPQGGFTSGNPDGPPSEPFGKPSPYVPTYCMLESFGSCLSPIGPTVESELTYRMPVSGSAAAPAQFAPPDRFGRISVPSLSPSTTDGGVYIAPYR